MKGCKRSSCSSPTLLEVHTLGEVADDHYSGAWLVPSGSGHHVEAKSAQSEGATEWEISNALG